MTSRRVIASSFLRLSFTVLDGKISGYYINSSARDNSLTEHEKKKKEIFEVCVSSVQNNHAGVPTKLSNASTECK